MTPTLTIAQIAAALQVSPDTVRAWWANQDMANRFQEGAQFGYDLAIADRAKVDAAKDECVEYLRARVITLVSAGAYDQTAMELLAALDAAKQEAGQ